MCQPVVNSHADVFIEVDIPLAAKNTHFQRASFCEGYRLLRCNSVVGPTRRAKDRGIPC